MGEGAVSVGSREERDRQREIEREWERGEMERETLAQLKEGCLITPPPASDGPDRAPQPIRAQIRGALDI